MAIAALRRGSIWIELDGTSHPSGADPHQPRANRILTSSWADIDQDQAVAVRHQEASDVEVERLRPRDAGRKVDVYDNRFDTAAHQSHRLSGGLPRLISVAKLNPRGEAT